MARIIREGRLQPQSGSGGIIRITVSGFKSIVQEQNIEIKPLTILAGANSSGKSSMMQPLLLLKQTLGSDFDPGALLLNGPNVKFTQSAQLLSRSQDGQSGTSFHIGIGTADNISLATYFESYRNRKFVVEQTIYSTGEDQYRLYSNMPDTEVLSLIERMGVVPQIRYNTLIVPVMTVAQNRCFLVPVPAFEGNGLELENAVPMPGETQVKSTIHQTIHLPGLRGRPERDYLSTAVGPTFPGTFEIYTASLIEQWQLDREKQKLTRLFSDLARLALTNKVIARRRNDTAIELLVNRFLQGDKEDMVSIADVGIGVSQALPVVVALHTANPGQLVYIEQPEIHLHPRAQYALAEVLADAAKEGKRLVIETHSSILLLGIQTLVAEGKLPPELVKLHWFTQQEDGSTKIDSADLDEAGAFGKWPEDFHSVTLQSENRYIDAAEARLMGE